MNAKDLDTSVGPLKLSVENVAALVNALRRSAKELRDEAGERGDTMAITQRGFAGGLESATDCFSRWFALNKNAASQGERSGRPNTQEEPHRP